MITVTSIPEYRKCDLPSCGRPSVREFTRTDEHRSPYRVFVCAEHEVEGFLRVRELP